MPKNKPTYEELEYSLKLLQKESKWLKQAQAALEQREAMLHLSECRYRLIFENVYDIILVFDRDFTILDISPSVEKALGYQPDDIKGRPFTSLNIFTPESLETAIGHASRLLEGKQMAPAVFEFVAKDGRKKIGEITANPLMVNGEVSSVVCIARDITDKR